MYTDGIYTDICTRYEVMQGEVKVYRNTWEGEVVMQFLKQESYPGEMVCKEERKRLLNGDP